ncbi:MAG: M3 family peptidase, partial [Robiginitomaculum sp.]|nr:M3 family peptidase [Robiginitomaculum sp.]
MRKLSKLTLTTAIAAVLALGVTSCGEKTPKQTESQMLIQDVETGNALLDKWTGPYGGVPPWDKADISTMSASLDTAFDMARAEITKVADNEAKPNFDNTIVAMEKSGAALSRVATVFFVHASNLNKGEIPNILKEMSPKFSELNDEINQNPALFARVKSVYDNRTDMNTEQK